MGIIRSIERCNTSRKVSASIEISPKQALESLELPGLFPQGVRVYITDIGSHPTQTLVSAAKRVRDLGYRAVPHFASRRLTTKAALEDRIIASTQDAGVTDILVVGGGEERPAGEFFSTMDVLATGFLDKYGITHVGVAGHPEGSPHFSKEVATEALRMKKSFGERTGAHVRIVTQFGFDGEKFVGWAEALSSSGIDLPVHLGIAGPTKVTSLVKYAAMCGVGNSVDFLKTKAWSLATLAIGYSPETVVGPIEQYLQEKSASPIEQIHVFPFGGAKNAAHWLKVRGSW